MKNLKIIALVLAIAWQCKHEPFEFKGTSSISNVTVELPPYINENCNSNTVYFIPQIKEIINSNCAIPGCHNSISRKHGVILNTYINIINTGDVDTDKFDPFDSGIYNEMVDSDPDERMPPVPAHLDQYQINLIKSWIEQGAKNNSCISCDTTNVRYTTHIEPMIKNACRGCHNSTTASLSLRDFTNYNSAKLSAPSMLKRMTLEHSNQFFMPLNGDQNPCNVHLIDRWIKNGTPE